MTEPRLSERAGAEVYDEIQQLRLKEAKHHVRTINQLQAEIAQRKTRLMELDNGAVPKNFDFDGDRIR